jgi:hypothetical protein
MKKTLLLGGLLAATLFANAQQRLVLYEEFSGENCGPCAAVNPGLWTLLTAGTNPNKIMLIKYQTPIPSGGPIYAQNTTDVGARQNYYNVPFAPYARMDGAISPGSASPNEGHPGGLTQPLIDAATAIAAPFNITVTNTVTGTTLNSTINVTAVAGYTGSGVKLRAALVETLLFTAPPGTNGETDFHHVVRKMYPSADGQTIPNTWTNGQTGTYTFSGTIPSYVDRTHELFVVVWIQNDADKKVAQTAKSTNLPAVPLDAGIVSATPSKVCGSSTVDHKIKIKNTGTTTITQATLFYKIGSGAYQAAPNWSGSLPAGQTSADITIGALNLPGGGGTITDSIGTLNAAIDNNPANNAFKSNALALATGAALPQSTGFEGAGIPTGYIVLDKNGNYVPTPVFNAETWFTHTEAGIKGQANSAYTCIAPCPNMEVGKTSVITFPYTSAPAGTKAVDFYYSYAQRGTVTGDKLELVYSTDCGQNWISVWNKTNADLAGGNPPTAANALFLPTAESNWKYASIDVSAINGNALVGFRATSGGGNLIFIDNIKFRTGTTTAIEELVSGGNVNLYPNPVTEQVTVELNMVKSAKVSFQVVNMLGQQVGQDLVKDLNAGQTRTTLSTNDLAPGVYFLNIVTDKGNLQQKFVKK